MRSHKPFHRRGARAHDKRGQMNRRALLRLAAALPLPLLLAACGDAEPTVTVQTPAPEPAAPSPPTLTQAATAAPASQTVGPDRPTAPTAPARPVTAPPGQARTAGAIVSAPPATAAPSPVVTASPSPSPAPNAAPVAALVATPACGDADDPTPAQSAGPFYTPNTPRRTNLREPGVAGGPLTVAGYVVSTGCQPVASALLDFWHCDSAGVYDNTGFRLRGHQFSDAQGRFALETILPAVYPGRTRHIHVRVQAPNRPVLTTQLYFPGEPANRTDSMFRAALVMDLEDRPDGKYASFTFVLDLT